MLRLGDTNVAEYVDGRGLDPTLAPRPHLHPIRSLGGALVTDAQPVDHRWHLGLSVALQDVDGWNLWGGPTFLRDRGYTARADHGRIDHTGFVELRHDGFEERLRWLTPSGEALLVEKRVIRARLVAHGWELLISTTLTNATDRLLRLGSPATNGRVGAGYGGLFWRLPVRPDPWVRTVDGEGEHAVHGATAPWIAWTDRAAPFTLVLSGNDPATRADPWFVRVADYPGIGSQLAARTPLLLPPAHTTTRGLLALLADDVLDDAAIQSWAATGRLADVFETDARDAFPDRHQARSLPHDPLCSRLTQRRKAPPRHPRRLSRPHVPETTRRGFAHDHT